LKQVPDESKTDELYGQRYHAWVMVSPHKRDVGGHFFIEATNGRIYPVENSPYFGIESLWNHRNYWVNMQGGNVVDNPRECATVGISDFNYDLTNTENWEYVFIDPLLRGPGNMEGDEGKTGEAGSQQNSPDGSPRTGSPNGSPRPGTGK